jgi:hypothetical protein
MGPGFGQGQQYRTVADLPAPISVTLASFFPNTDFLEALHFELFVSFIHGTMIYFSCHCMNGTHWCRGPAPLETVLVHSATMIKYLG